MAAHWLEIRTPAGERLPFSGPVGIVMFHDGLSVERHDTDSWPVRRLLSADDGGGNVYPQMRIAREPDPPPAPPPTVEPDPEPAQIEMPDGSPPRQRGRRRP